MHLCVLASGSKGNSLYLRSGETRILIDAGIGIRSLTRALATLGDIPEHISAVFITHEHTDHTAGLNRLLHRAKTPVYGSAGTLAVIEHHFPSKLKTSVINGNVSIGPFSVRAIPISHDAAEPLAYAIEVENQIITVATDLGEVCPELQEAMRHAACAVIESNHDEQLLAAGSYPSYLKERIRSSTGHLSNRQTASALSACGGNGLKHVVLAHLSEENNEPSLARDSAISALCNETISVHLTAQGTMGPYLNL